jgi:hypothetical protein
MRKSEKNLLTTLAKVAVSLFSKPDRPLRGTAKLVADRMKAHEGIEKKSEPSRQQDRAAKRKGAMANVNAEFGQEVRPARRGLALRPFRPKNHLKGPRAGRVRARAGEKS